MSFFQFKPPLQCRARMSVSLYPLHSPVSRRLAQPVPTACGLWPAAPSRHMDVVGLPPSPDRAPFKRAKVAAAAPVPHNTVCSSNRAHVTWCPPYRVSAPHCWSTSEATGFEATATFTSSVSSSNRPSLSSIRLCILLPFLTQCSRAHLRPPELCRCRRPSRVSSSLRHLARGHPAASPMLTVKTASRTHRRWARGDRVTADGRGARTIPWASTRHARWHGPARAVWPLGRPVPRGHGLV
jgi:hypothetical protein